LHDAPDPNTLYILHVLRKKPTNPQGEYEIEKSSTTMHGIPAWCTLTGFILAMDKKKSDTICSPPWKQNNGGSFAINTSPAFCTLDAPSK
jgi:hypothetical protein